MKVLVLPRDPNPYQNLLYGEMKRLGAQVTYIGELTRSHTLNVLLLPVEVAVRRFMGARFIHLHWVFFFALPGSRTFPAIRAAAQVLFLIWLTICRMLGLHLVWTAHNTLPHRRVFADDVSARRALVRSSDLVIAHSPSALAELTALGAIVRRSVVIPHGPIVPERSTTPPEPERTSSVVRRFLFFGRVEEYKGVDDLLAAFAALPEDVAAHLVVAGQCDDLELRSRLTELAARTGSRTLLRLERIPEVEVGDLLYAADVVVLPFRRVTTSGSAMLALSCGRPLVVPRLPGLADLPDQAVRRYDGGIPALSEAIVSLARAEGRVLASMSAAARGYSAEMTWHEIAERTAAAMLSVLNDAPKSAGRSRSAVAS